MTPLPTRRRLHPPAVPPALLAGLLSLASLSLLAASATTRAHDFSAGDLAILHPSAPPTPPGVSSAAGYLVIVNEGDETERLLGGDAAPFARGVEIHRTTVVDDVSRMRRLDDGLEIPPGATVRLEPGGTHLMFTGLVDPLPDGERRRAVLVFERAGAVDVEFAIERPTTVGAADDGDTDLGDMDHGDMDHDDADQGGMDHDDTGHGDMDHGDAADAGTNHAVETNHDGEAGHDGTDHGVGHDDTSGEGSADDRRTTTLDVK